MKKIDVSIIIPVYNVSSYIEKSIISVVNQTLTNIEIICVNDGSTDDSWEKIKKVATSDDRLVLIDSKENHGLSFARNKGLNVAKGSYIMFLDSDDSLVKDAVEIAYYKIKQNDLDMLIYGFQYEYETDELKSKYYIPLDDLSIYESQIYSGFEFLALCEKDKWPVIKV